MNHKWRDSNEPAPIYYDDEYSPHRSAEVKREVARILLEGGPRNPVGWDKVDGVQLPSVATWAELPEAYQGDSGDETGS